MTSGSENLSPELERKLEAIADEYLELLWSGLDVNPDEFSQQYGELAERVRGRLYLVKKIHEAACESRDGLVTEFTIDCPSCASSIQISEPNNEKIICPGCGGEFLLRSDSPSVSSGRVGDTLGRFEILELLGQGSFGSVYLAWDAELQRDVTLKVPRHSAFQTPGDEERFFREARSVSGLRHPGIVRVLEITEVDNLPVIVREYIDGHPLDEVIEKERLSFNEATTLVRNIAEALYHAHQRDVIHRDIKPANILIDSEGLPHVTDFGLAKQAGSQEVTMTLEGQVLGTPAYMSPEQAQGKRDLIGPQSDQFSLGVVFYELLTGDRPFTGQRSMVLEQVIYRDPRPPRTFNSRIPRDLETICLRAMAKEPHRRYESLRALSEDLDNFLQGCPINARPITAIERLWLWSKRRKLIATLIASVVILLLTVTVTSVLNANRERRQRQERTRQVSKLHIQSGLKYFENRNFFKALPHLTESLRLEPGDKSDSEAIKRLRIGTLLLHSPRLLNMWFFDQPVVDTHFSPDGKHLAIAEVGGRVSLYEVPSGRLIHSNIQHPQELRSIRFHPYRKLLLTACEDGNARIWDWQRGVMTRSPLVHKNHLGYALFSPDGKRIITATSGGLVHIWDLKDESPRAVLKHPKNVLKAFFFPDSQRVATISSDGHPRIWDADTEKILHLIPQVPGLVKLDIHPDGDSILVVAWNRYAQMYDARTGKKLGARMTAGYGTNAAVYSDDGKKIAISGWGTEGGIFDSRTGKPITPPLQQRFGLSDLQFSPDSQRVAFIGTDNRLRIWDAHSGKRVTPLMSHGPHAGKVRFHPNGHMVLTINLDGSLTLWDLSRRQPGRPLGRHSSWVTDMRIIKGGDKVLSGDSSGRSKIWDMKSVRWLAYGPPHWKGTLTLDVRPQGDLAATLGVDLFVRVWRVKDGSLEHAFQLESQGRHVNFSPDGQLLAVTETKGFVRFFEVDSGQELPFKLNVGYKPLVLRFSPDGRYLVSGGANSNLQVFDIRTGSRIGPDLQTGVNNTAVAISEKAERLVAVNVQKAGVWDPRNGKLIQEFEAHLKSCKIIEFSPLGNSVLIADVTGIARVWDPQTGKPVTRKMRAMGTYSTGQFTSDGRLVALGSSDGIAKIYDAQTGDLVVPSVIHKMHISALEFTKGDSIMVTASYDKMIASWDLQTVNYSTEDLQWLTRALTGTVVDPELGDIEILDIGKVQEAWQEAKSRTPEEFKLNLNEVLAWHYSGKIQAERNDNPRVEIFHLDHLIHHEPWTWLHYNRRGAAHNRAKDYLTAIPDGIRSVSLLTFDILSRAAVGIKFPADRLNEWSRGE